jgi:hypothetical protein
MENYINKQFMFLNFAFLSNVIRWDVNHPFAQCIHKIHATYPLVT